MEIQIETNGFIPCLFKASIFPIIHHSASINSIQKLKKQV